VDYRVYFNQAKEAPQIWSVDQGDVSTELNVSAVHIEAFSFTASNLEQKWPEPKAWLVVPNAQLSIRFGVAVITPQSNQEIDE
jgi:hypothetical protein